MLYMEEGRRGQCVRLFEVDPMLVVTNGLEGKVSTLLFIMCVWRERGAVIVAVVINLWDLHLFYIATLLVSYSSLSLSYHTVCISHVSRI
jgi:hypothetical protein